jgi:hypothetical protein
MLNIPLIKASDQIRKKERIRTPANYSGNKKPIGFFFHFPSCSSLYRRRSAFSQL